ncbi:MAG: dTDP-4-dehydrorhamnose reductase [Bacteroidetes bacterium]|jgi:dTDP-4-dehydrorhamnose reductase|nr:dTDP-4-dehydrorhamnose reductase [Bacteroidota bacterium]|tara:strand:- start:820 stop:1680 length:861 start_codon:yes stop_codon:yes gene_type:complete
MNNIVVTGSNGQLGSEIRAIASQFSDYNFIFTDVDELDITKSIEVELFFRKNNISVCINCAAYTAVDNAEDERELAMLINYESVENLANVCNVNNTLLIQISTDYVFNGQQYRPYVETDLPAPDSYYGLTKLKSEQAVMEIAKKSIVIRTSWLYSSFGNNFVKTMMRLGRERDELGVVVDQIGTPTFAADLANAIMKIIQKTGDNHINEIYNYSNEGAISWYDFAKAIMAHANINCRVNAIESKDFPSKAKRPYYSVLNKAKIKNDFQIDVPYWLDSLKVMISKLD